MTTYREAFQPCHEHQPGYGRFMPGCIGCLSMTIGNLCDLLDEARQMNDAHHLLFSAHQENFIQRIYALEGGDQMLDIVEERFRQVGGKDLFEP